MCRHSDDPVVRRDESGQTMVEYAVVLAVITAAIVASIAVLSATTTDMVSNIVDFL